MSLVDPMVRAGAWAAGSDAPEKPEVKIGFIPLTDCASVVMAAVLGLDKKYGVKITPVKEASWPGVRDKLINGELDFAHVLYGLIYGVQLGIGGPRKDMAVLMSLNQNGQAITISNKLKAKGVRDGESLAKFMKAAKGEYTFAQTFPTGTHAMWLYYWLGAYGIHPMRDAKVITVPPPQMVANMRVGNMDGFCVGEPWNARAIMDEIGFTATTSQAIWPGHPEKVLGTTADFAQRYPNTARAAPAPRAAARARGLARALGNLRQGNSRTVLRLRAPHTRLAIDRQRHSGDSVARGDGSGSPRTVFGAFLRQRPERPGHRLEPALVPAARGHRLRAGGPDRHSRRLCHRALRGRQRRGLAAHQPAPPGLAPGLAATRAVVVQVG